MPIVKVFDDCIDFAGVVSCGGQAAWLGDSQLAGVWGTIFITEENNPWDLVVWAGGTV